MLKSCNVDNESNYSQLGNSDPCAVGDWIDKPCNANCGRGMKKQQRAYLDDSLATQAGCNIQLTRRVECYGRCEEHSGKYDFGMTTKNWSRTQILWFSSSRFFLMLCH